jgi:hypothetical protein
MPLSVVLTSKSISILHKIWTMLPRFYIWKRTHWMWQPNQPLSHRTESMGIRGEFQPTYTNSGHPSLDDIVTRFKESRASSTYRTKVIGSRPASMGHDFRAAVSKWRVEGIQRREGLEHTFLFFTLLQSHPPFRPPAWIYISTPFFRTARELS